ncbi:MAG: triose-phosphate isomerase [Candidatus Limnocylindrales bacterium]
MRPVIVAGNWKMNTTPSSAGDLARAIADATDGTDVQRVLFPPYVCLAQVRDALRGRGLEVGAQNLHEEAGGAYTGEISGQMLRELATWVIVGHSERRRDQAETDEIVGRKLRRACEAGLTSILCVGELLEARQAGKAEQVVEAQLRGALSGVADRAEGHDFAIAYEPVWAIGTGETATGADAARMAGVIRATLARLGLDRRADGGPVLYGGSVTSASIGEFLAEPALDGALVGGASLKVDEMAGIVAAAGLVAAARRGAEGLS